jgi:hypothetical protein
VEGAAAEEIDDESGRGGRAEEVAEVRIGRARELEDLDLLARQAGGEGDDPQVVYCNDPGKKSPTLEFVCYFLFRVFVTSCIIMHLLPYMFLSNLKLF